MKHILTIILAALLALLPAFAAEWRAEGDVTESGEVYTFDNSPDGLKRFASSGILTPFPQPTNGYSIEGEFYLPATIAKSRKTLAFLLGPNPASGKYGDVGAEMVLIRAGRPPLAVAGPYTGADTLRNNYEIKKRPDWLLMLGTDALCAVGAVVMMRWGRIWGPAPESWGGGTENYILGYGGAAFFIAAGVGVTLWQLLAPTGKAEAIGYPFPTTGVKPPAEKWTSFTLHADGSHIKLYIDDELALNEPDPGPGLAIHSVEGFEARLKGLGVE